MANQKTTAEGKTLFVEGLDKLIAHSQAHAKELRDHAALIDKTGDVLIELRGRILADQITGMEALAEFEKAAASISAQIGYVGVPS